MTKHKPKRRYGVVVGDWTRDEAISAEKLMRKNGNWTTARVIALPARKARKRK